MPTSKANTSGIHIKRKSNVFTGHERTGEKEKSPMKKRKNYEKPRKQLVFLHFLSAKMDGDKQSMLSLSTTKFTHGSSAKIIQC